MDKSKIEDSCMKQLLLKAENIPVLEELLDKNSQQLERLQKLNEENKLDLGKIVDAEELQDLFPKICREVDDFLGIHDVRLPGLDYFSPPKPSKLKPTLIMSAYTLSILPLASAAATLCSDRSNILLALAEVGSAFLAITTAFAWDLQESKTSSYDDKKKLVILEKNVKTDLIPTAAHEYAHHVQYEKGIKGAKYSIFREGHAQVVQKQLAKNYREREDNEAFFYHALERDVARLKTSYVWTCRKLGYQPKENLLKIKTNCCDNENWWIADDGDPSRHAVGNAVFSINEIKHGKQIYDLKADCVFAEK